MINGLEIFSGAGGLATGVGLSGISHNAFVEWNSDACKTLRMNYPASLIHETDIRDFDFSRYNCVDFIAGGPPCQPFSLGGKAQSHLDKRDMFPAAIRAIREVLPKVFMFENVKGLLRPGFKEYLSYIVRQLEYPTISGKGLDWERHSALIDTEATGIPASEQYDVTVTLVNAADYGVPQKRERVVIAGIRKDLHCKWEFPKPTHSLDALLWDKYVTGEYWERHSISPDNHEHSMFREKREELKLKFGLFPPETKPWQTIRDALTDMPNAGDENYFDNEHTIRKGAKEYPGHTGSPVDEPSKTIKAGCHGVPGGENMMKLRDGTLRYFTIFEAKRIQTFPDNYRISGSWTEAMRQLGNAVPVRLANLVSRSLIASALL